MGAYKTLLAGVDFSNLDELSVRAGVELARSFHAERLHLVHVVAPHPSWALSSADLYSSAFVSTFRAELESAEAKLARIEPPDDVRVTREVRTGPIARELTLAAEEVGADLIVTASHPRGRIGRFVLGSVASTLVRVSRCPVLVVGPDRPLRMPLLNVVAAIDSSPIAAEVVAHAASFAIPSGGRLRVLSSYELRQTTASYGKNSGVPVAELINLCESRYRDEINAIALRARNAGVETVIDLRFNDDPKAMIVDFAEATRPSLVCIGTSGHNAWERFFLGATASRVIAEAPCPVLVIPFPASTNK